jgi:hypothetical protein
VLKAPDGRVMSSTSHPVDFSGWKAQLDDLSQRETGDGNKYYNDIRDELYREMDQAESSFVYSSWIPGTIWPEPYDKIYGCLGTGDDPGQWNVARCFLRATTPGRHDSQNRPGVGSVSEDGRAAVQSGS